MEHTRRKVLTGIGATLAIGVGAPQAFGQESDTPEFQVLEVSSTGEYIVFVNMTTAEVDLSGWTVDFEYGSDGSGEKGTIPSGTSVQARDTIKIASGAGETPDDGVVVEDPFDEKVIDTDGNDVIALLDSDGNEVANSGDDLFGSGGGGDSGSSGGDGDDGAGDETTEDETTTEEETTTPEDETTEGTTTTEEETTTEEKTTSTDDGETTTTSEETTSDDGTDGSGGDESDDTTDDGSGGSDDGSGQMSSSSESDSEADESSDDDC
ncbi:lamin tail domain-containing protein [Haladaptatus sp. DYF46]|uniref:lamin tail domain-containing protein n=1 Tax=Haladaptatus sp. DYF46 TaxID=2886041 RepID=UPI001E5B98A8|nr:lamin tail domain-containing protein [Haladaptatus sp. DYF46]